MEIVDQANVTGGKLKALELAESARESEGHHQFFYPQRFAPETA